MTLMGGVLAINARADEWNRKTTMTFATPVEIPGVHLKGWGVLPAGTYVFKIMDSQVNRHIVQIFNKEETMVYATILAIPNYRLKTTDKTVLTFRERPASQPEALRAWFYPGRTFGEEFVYPKGKATELAKSTDTPVLFTPPEIPSEVTAPIQSADKPVDEQVLTDLKRAPILAVRPSGEEVQLAQVITAPPAEPQMIAQALPATASPLPLIAMFGLLTLGAALAVRMIERRVE
jgi:hypothetical protein